MLELEVFLLECLLLGGISGLSKQIGSCLATVGVVIDIVVVELCCAFVIEVRLLSEFGWGISTLNQVVLQPLWIKRLIENVGDIH